MPIGTGAMLGAAGISAGGSLLSGYMQAQAQEDMFDEQMDIRKKELRHQKSQDYLNNKRLDKQLGLSINQDARQNAQFTNYMRDDAKNQSTFLATVKALNSRYGGASK